MSISSAVLLLLVVAVVAANYPWLSQKVFFIFPEPAIGKSAWMRCVEWLLNFTVVLLFGLGLERKINGVIHVQQWEFFVVGFLFFMVLAMPGFIYRYDLSRYLRRYNKQKAALKK